METRWSLYVAAVLAALVPGCSGVVLPEPGAVFADPLRSGGKGPEMVVVPSGQFRMGCSDSDRTLEVEHPQDRCRRREQPAHVVTIARSFAVSRYEVTFEDYERFRPSASQPQDMGWGRGRRPVIHVSWEDAAAYAAWLSRETGRAYRLLSEAEWEYVARAGSTTEFSWGDLPGDGRANCRGCSSAGDIGKTVEVGSFAANAWGLHDVHGNVWEWVQDCWNRNYEGAPGDGSARSSGDCARRVTRGGSWLATPGYMRSANRGRWRFGQELTGLRVAARLDRQVQSGRP